MSNAKLNKNRCMIVPKFARLPRKQTYDHCYKLSQSARNTGIEKKSPLCLLNMKQIKFNIFFKKISTQITYESLSYFMKINEITTF